MNEELRYKAIKMAKKLIKYNELSELLDYAEVIEYYLMTGKKPVKKKKPDDAAARIAKILPFGIHEFQKEIINTIDRGKKILINTARQMGISTILYSYALHYAEENPNKNILIVSDTFAQISDRFRSIYEELKLERNKAEVCLPNGSTITGKPITNCSVRGKTIDLLIIDNATNCSHKLLYELWETLMPQFNPTTTKIVLAGTPNPIDPNSSLPRGLFYDIWMSGGSEWRKIMVPWYRNPDHTDGWANGIKTLVGEDSFASEYCCEFSKKI